jgi:hypothetical protein
MECHTDDHVGTIRVIEHISKLKIPISQTISTAFTVGSVNMSSFQAVKKAVTIAPTVRTLPTGVPNAPFLNFVARAPSHGHGDHGHSSGPRSDKPARFVGSVKTISSGLISKTFVGAYRQIPDQWSCSE